MASAELVSRSSHRKSVEDLDIIDDEPDDPAPPATDPLSAPAASTAQQLVGTHDQALDIDPAMARDRGFMVPLSASDMIDLWSGAILRRASGAILNALDSGK